MEIYAEDNYKQALRARIKEMSRSKKSVTLKKVAEKIPIQYTYLSKVMNDEKAHLSEDHLFIACKVLEFFPEEIDYLMLLRQRATCHDPGRGNYLQAKIHHVRESRKLNASIQDFNSQQFTREMGYLFDPLCILVHVSLHIDQYFEDPRKLCGLLGITFSKLKEVLKKLAQLDFIALDQDGFTVVKTLKGHIHYSTDHPLMRMHQQALRAFGQAQILKTDEQDKHNFMVTFSADNSAFQRIKELFLRFVEEVEKEVIRSPSRQTYQLNFDLFKWV